MREGGRKRKEEAKKWRKADRKKEDEKKRRQKEGKKEKTGRRIKALVHTLNTATHSR